MSDSVVNREAGRASSLLAGIGQGLRRLDGRRFRGFVVCVGVLILVFSGTFVELGQFAVASELYSYILLVPLISLYLAGLRIREVRVGTESAWRLALLLLAVAAGALAVGQGILQPGWQFEPADPLAFRMIGFVALVTAAAFAFLGRAFVRSLAFPFAFLVFMAPFPTPVENGIEVFFQKASAETAAILLKVTNVPYFREDMVFRIPGIVLEVAEECSGIRSSVVLFLTSLVGGSLLLRTTTSRALLALAVIPLAILRNGVRILTVSLLCVHVSPDMIDSAIHRRGGPLFFALSLIPFLALMIFLRRWERMRLQRTRTERRS